jgi:hypothetical protein
VTKYASNNTYVSGELKQTKCYVTWGLWPEWERKTWIDHTLFQNSSSLRRHKHWTQVRNGAGEYHWLNNPVGGRVSGMSSCSIWFIELTHQLTPNCIHLADRRKLLPIHTVDN